MAPVKMSCPDMKQIFSSSIMNPPEKLPLLYEMSPLTSAISRYSRTRSFLSSEPAAIITLKPLAVKRLTSEAKSSMCPLNGAI